MKYLLTLFLCAAAFGADEGERSRHTAGLVGRWIVPGYQGSNAAAPVVFFGPFNGTAVGALTAAMFSRYAVTFGGAQYIQLNNSISTLTTTTGSIACWLLPTDTDLMNNFFSVCATNGSRSELHFMFDYRPAFTKRLDFFAMQDGTIKWRYQTANASAVPLTGKWVQVVVTHNGTTPSFYINGAPANGTFSTSTSLSPWFKAVTVDALNKATSVRIGSVSEGGSDLYWTGKISGVAIFNRALTAAEVAALYKEGLR